MTAIPIRIAPHDPWADIDEGMAPMSERLERSARAAAMARAIPPKPEPTAEEIAADRRRSDDAMRGLAEDYLSLLDKGLRTFARQERRAIRGGSQ